MASLALGWSGMAHMGPHGVPLGPFWPILRSVSICEPFFAAVTHFLKIFPPPYRSYAVQIGAIEVLS